MQPIELHPQYSVLLLHLELEAVVGHCGRKPHSLQKLTEQR